MENWATRLKPQSYNIKVELVEILAFDLKKSKNKF